MKPIRLVLTPEQTAIIRKHGMRFMAGSPFLIGNTGLAVLHLFSCDRDTANAACALAGGTLSAGRVDAAQTPPAPRHPDYCGQ